MSSIDDIPGAVIREPGLDDCLRGHGQIPIKEHLLPDDWAHLIILDFAMNVGNKVLKRRRQDLSVVGFNAFIEEINVLVDLVTTGVEVRRVVSQSRQQIAEKSRKEPLHGRILELQGSGWRLRSICGPVGLDVPPSNEFGVSCVDNTGMARHIDLDDNLHTSLLGILQDHLDVIR